MSTLRALVEGSKCVEDLVDLESALHAAIVLARRKKAAVKELAEAAEWHIRARRQIGILLIQDAANAARCAKSHDATSRPKRARLPNGIDKHLARRCRELARISKDKFEQYFASVAALGRLPTHTGAVVFVKPRVIQRAAGRCACSRSSGLPAPVTEAIRGFLGVVDVCVGRARIDCATRVSRRTASEFPFRGTVLIAECDNYAAVIPAVLHMRLRGEIEQGLVVLRLGDLARWREPMSIGDWSFCVLGPTHGNLMLAYQGARTRAFVLSFSRLGFVISGHSVKP